MAGLNQVIEDILRLCEVKAEEKVILYTGQRYDESLLHDWMVALNNLETDFLRVIAPTMDRNKKLINPGGLPLANHLFKGADMVVQVDRTCQWWEQENPPIASLHTPEFKKVREANPNLRWLLVQLTYPEINYRRLFPSQDMINRSIAGAKVYEKAKEIKIVSEGGTDFTCRKDGRPGRCQIGIATKDHTWDNYGCGNVSTTPIEDSAQGVIVANPGSNTHWPNSPEKVNIIREPLTITFEDGKIVNIEGGLEAKLMKKAMARYDIEKNPMLYRIAHIGWGTNERAVDLDNRLYCVGDWESTYGNMMIHFGGYGGIGGVHFSGPSIMDQDFYLDGEPIVKNNKIVHPQCK